MKHHKDALVAAAEEHGIDASGTKDALAERLAAGFLSESKEIDFLMVLLLRTPGLCNVQNT